MVRDAAEWAEAQRLIVKNAVVYLPLVGLLVITINIFVQVRGNVGLAIAVAQNLSFGALALTVLLNLVTYFTFGLLIGLIPIVFDSEYNPHIRGPAITAFILTLLIVLYSTSWTIWVGLVVIAGGLRYLTWRMEQTSRTRALVSSETAGTPIAETLRSDSPPQDIELRELWLSGREMLRVTGNKVTKIDIEKMLPKPTSPKTLSDVAGAWNLRRAEINAPLGRKTITTLFFSGMIGFVGIYGVSILTQPIRFAPLELVSINDAAPEAGYLLMPSEKGIFLPETLHTLQYLSATDHVHRELCQSNREWWNSTLFQAISPPERLHEVDCA